MTNVHVSGDFCSLSSLYIILVRFAFILVLMMVPAFFLMIQGVDRDPGIIRGNFLVRFPPIFILLIGVFTTYQAVLNTVRALSDQPMRYPLSIPFVE